MRKYLIIVIICSLFFNCHLAHYFDDKTFSSDEEVKNPGTETVPRTGLVGEWLFSGNANDTSGNGYNGTVNGAVLTQDRFANNNKAYQFNGISDNIDITINLPDFNAITISLWRNSQGNGGGGCPRIITLNLNTTFEHDNNFQDNINITLMNFNLINGTNPQSLLNQNEWQNIIITWDGTYANVYINSTNIVSNLNYTLTINGVHVQIGGGGGNAQNRYFNGFIDDIRIYNRALSSSEISSLYHENGY